MIISVLWEDSRSAAANRFGAHELLLACVADDLGVHSRILNQHVRSLPKNGNTNVRKALQKDYRHLQKYGPVIAVIDRDQVHGLWPTKPPPPSCRSGMVARFRQDASGDYDLVLLEKAMETLVEVTCQVFRRPVPPKDTEERDHVLQSAAWPPSGTADSRYDIRRNCPSFARIVATVGGYVRPTLRTP